MDETKVASIVDKIAAEQVGDESLAAVDAAVDRAALALQAIGEALQTIKAETPQEKQAKDKMQDIFDTALMPYMADFIEALTAFEGEEE